MLIQRSQNTINLHQKTFEFAFNIDRVQASIFRSNADPTKPDRLLVNAVLEGFQFEFGLRPFDMSVDILLRSLYIEDKMVEEQTEFRHLVTSGGEQEQDLVRIRYQGVQKASPEFMTVHEGIDKVSFGWFGCGRSLAKALLRRRSMSSFLRSRSSSLAEASCVLPWTVR